MRQDTDFELIQLTLNDDSEAFGELIRRYQDAVYATALHQTGNFSSAQDIAQDTFIEAFKSLRRLSDPARFSGWLYSITLHQCNRWYRKQKDILALDDLEETQIALMSGKSVPPPDEEAEYNEFQSKVLKAINSLPDRTGEVVTMYYIDGLSYGEIADFLSIPATTVKGHLQRGRKQLKKELIAMVEDVLKSNKPDEKFSKKVLDEIIKQTESARKEHAHDEILKLCDKALEVLDHLDTSEENQNTRINVLRWQVYEMLGWFGRPEEAIGKFAQIAKIAESKSDASMQATWLLMQAKAISLANNHKSMLEPVKKAYELYSKLGDIYGQVVCEGLIDLVSALPVDWQPVDVYDRKTYTGYRVHTHRLLYTADSISYIEDDAKERKSFAELIGYGSDMWRTAGLLSRIGKISQILKLPPTINLSWTDKITEIFHNQTMPATRTIEANDDTIIVPAGKFENCLRVVTKIEEPSDADFSDSSKIYCRRIEIGKQTIWFAPGVGIVKFHHEDIRGGNVCGHLVEYNVNGKENDYLPFNIGNFWKYERYIDWLQILITENYKLASKKDDSAYITCGTYSNKIDGQKLIEYLKAWQDCEKASSDIHGELIVLSNLMDAYARSNDLDPLLDAYKAAIQLAEHDPFLKAKVVIDAMNRMEDVPYDTWMEDLIDNIRHALNLFEDVDLSNYQQFLRFAADFFIRHGRYEEALEYAKKSLEIGIEFKNTGEIVFTEAEIDLANMLSQDKDAKNAIKGGCRRILTIEASESGVVCKRLDGVIPMRFGARPIPPVYCYEFNTDSPLIKYPAKAGDEWTFNDYEGRIKRLVEDVGLTVKVPAGSFDNVICIKSSVNLRPDDKIFESDKSKYELNKGFCEGEKRLWFAKGVGLIRSEHKHANGKKTVIELTSYHISNNDDSYFPLALGNIWDYEWHDENGDLLFKERDRIVQVQEDKFHFACSGYTTNKKEYLD